MSMVSDLAREVATATEIPLGLGRLGQVPVRLTVEVGGAALRLADVLALEEGGVVELDRKADEPLDIMVNGTLIARGEVVVTDGRFGIRLIEIVGGDGGWALAEALG